VEVSSVFETDLGEIALTVYARVQGFS